MRPHRLAVLGFALLLLVAARSDPARADTAGGRFGIGAMVGKPTGLSAQVRLGGPLLGSALDAAVGLELLDNNHLYAHLDYVVFALALIEGDSVWMPAYFGAGLFVRDATAGFGARLVGGLQIDLRHTHVGFFAEIAARVSLVDQFDGALGGSIGIRYYF